MVWGWCDLDVKGTLLKLCKAHGVSGREREVAKLIKTMLAPYSNSIFLNPLGSVVAKISEAHENYPEVLLEAHIDQVGLIVTSITDDGFLKVANCGGIDVGLLISQEVIVCGNKNIHGIICSIPPHLKKSKSKTPLTINDIYIDIGMSKSEAEKIIDIGNVVTYNYNPVCLMGNRISVKSLDNRAGVMAVLLALEKLKQVDYKCGLTVAFSSMEETSGKGAATSGYFVNPDLAICVDVSFAQTVDCPKNKCGDMGKGPMIGISPTLDFNLSSKLQSMAKKEKIPYQLEVMGGATSTDADKICVVRDGVVTGLCSIPLKYMHSPVEVVDIDDIENTANLLANFVMLCKDDVI